MKLLENWPLRPLGLIAVILIGISAQGCALSGDVEPTDLSAIRIGATREQVESALGKPIASEATESGTIVTYVYDRGAVSGSILNPVKVPIIDDMDRIGPPGLVAVPVAIATAPIWAPITIARVNKRDKETIRAQKGHLKVIYGPDDTVIHYVITLTRHQAEREIQELIRSGLTRQQAEQITQELINADQEYAEVQYQTYHVRLRQNPQLMEGAWKGLCLAANHGHVLAQHRMGNLELWGWIGPGGTRPDDLRREASFVQAYIWYSLAASNGHGPSESARERIAKQMRPERIAEAERLVIEWKPGSCGL